ncbi:MAG: hypothetical protein JO069_00820 [Verrucomicrobia bacterium]|nr:hypothetical protein [Verrucomicrobiota bacterium]
MVLVVGVLVRVSRRRVRMLMAVQSMRIRWFQARRMSVLMLRGVVGVRVGMGKFVVRVRMNMRGHAWT